MNNQDIPHIKAYVRGIENNKSVTHEAIIHAIRARQGRAFTVHAHLSCGAHYSLLTLDKVTTRKNTKPAELNTLQPWDCFSDELTTHQYAYFKDRKVLHQKLGPGKYWFTADFLNNPFSDDPQEFKQFHFVTFDSGLIGCYPNNMLLFQEKTFTGELNWKAIPKLKPQQQYPSAEY